MSIGLGFCACAAHAHRPPRKASVVVGRGFMEASVLDGKGASLANGARTGSDAKKKAGRGGRRGECRAKPQCDFQLSYSRWVMRPSRFLSTWSKSLASGG